MFASLLIILLSLILLVYWLRYSCILLLKRHADQPIAVEDTTFSFAEVSQRLKNETDLDPLRRSLSRDYQVLIYLVEHASGLGLESFEDRLLVLDYKMMQWWYRITRVLLPGQARAALSEMASVLGVLSQRIGEQAGVCTRA
jgi:hypothetical protein